MPTKGTYNATIMLRDRESRELAQAAAAALGCLQSTGHGAGKVGSLSALIQAIADGQVVALNASVLATVVTLLTDAYEKLLPREPGRAEVLAALRLLGHAPAGEDDA